MPQTARHDEEAVYQIRVQDLLGEGWSDWLGGLAITPRGSGDTLLTGPVRDQSALHGILAKIRDLGLPLLSIKRVDATSSEKWHPRCHCPWGVCDGDVML
jgi:hypothetical protein